jgi:hypothetical protein
VAFKFKFGTLLCAAGLISVVQVNPAEAQAIRACANPAGHLRLIGATDSCKSQETLVTWNAAGTPGGEGVVGGNDQMVPGSPPAQLTGTPTILTDENIATGFPGYMVWANVALQFNSGNPMMGSAPSPQNAACQISYTVTGRVGTFLADGRSVIYPTNTIGQNDRLVQMVVGLTGLIGKDLTPPLSPSESVDISLTCHSPGFTPPPMGPLPVLVKVTSWTLSGIGVAKGFQ